MNFEIRNLIWRTIAFFLLLGLSISLFFYQSRDVIEQVMFDLLYENEYVDTSKEIEETLSKFKIVTINELPDVFRRTTKLNEKKYLKMVSKMNFYEIKKKDVYRKIAGNIRIKDVIARDSFYKSSHWFSEEKLFLGIDERILHKILNLQNALSEEGYDRNAFWVRYGHRHPHLNEEVKGASKSRHIAGEAVDLVIKDINKDGSYTDEDKQIVIKLCEERIIKNGGGIGKYPGTRTVHIDVRGYKARWNSY